MSFQYDDIVEGKPSRIIEGVPDIARGKIINAVNRDPAMLAEGRVEILTKEGKRYWMVGETVTLVLPANPSFPEHEKLTKVKERSQAIGEFLAWATSDKGFSFGREVSADPDDDPFFQVAGEQTVQDLLGEFFGIDRARLDKEKELMREYAHLR